MKLTYARVTLWKPGSSQTKVVFHVFDAHNPSVLLGKTGVLATAKGMVEGKLPLAVTA